MRLRKSIAQCEQTHSISKENEGERDIKPNTITNTSVFRKQNEKLSQNNNNFNTKISAKGFKIIKRRIANCYF